MKIKLHDSAYSKHFEDVLYSWDRYIIAYGGRGSGKTDTFYLKYLLSLFEPYYFRLAYVNKERSGIKDSQYAGFKRVAIRHGLYDKLRFYDGTYHITNPANGNALIPKGMDDPEKTKGLDDITAIWWDEINKGSEEDFAALNALLRSPMAKYLQFAISFNPVSEKHWLRKFFFDETDSYKIHARFKSEALLNHSTVFNNEFIDIDAYVRSLKLMYGYSVNLTNINIYGKWGIEQNINPWFEAFNENRHVSKTIIEPYSNLPIYISFDFNINPMCAIVGQHSQTFNSNSWCHLLKAYKIENPKEKEGIIDISVIDKLCDQIKKDYPFNIIYATGDSNGRSRNAGYGNNDSPWAMIIRKLKLGPVQMKAPLSNLSHKSSRFNNNYILYNFPKLLINPTCSDLINEITIAKPIKTENQEKEDELFKGPAAGEYGMNLVDCFRYYNDTFLSPFVKKV